MRLQELCEVIVDDVDGALACAFVDLDTGLPLALRIVPGGVLNPASMDAISAAGADYFRGTAMRRLEREMSTGGESPGSFVEEIQTTTEDTYHFMSVVPGQQNKLMILITDKNANLGLGWVSMREALARVGEDGGGASEDRFGAASGAREEAPDPYDAGVPAWRGRRGRRGYPGH